MSDETKGLLRVMALLAAGLLFCALAALFLY